MSLQTAISGRHPDLPQLESTWTVSPFSMPAVLSFWDIVGLAFKWKFLLLAAFLTPLAASIVLIFVMPPTYRAQTSLVVGTGPEYLAQGDGNSAMTAPTSTKQEFINTEIELLNSLAVAKATIERVGVAEIYPDILKSPPKSGTPLDAAVVAFRAAIHVEPVKLSNLINVSFDHRNPVIASKVLDQFINSYEDLHANVFSSRRARSYEETIARDTAELEKLEHERASVKAAGDIYDLVTQRSALIMYRVDAQKRLHETIDSLTRLQDRLTYLSKVRPQLSSEIRSVMTDPRAETVHARQMLFDLQQKEVTLLGTYSPSSPMVQRVQMQIETLQRIMQNMEDTVSRVTTSVSPITTAIDQELINSKAEITPLQAQKERYETIIKSIEDQLQHIERGDSQLRILDAHIDAQNDNLKAMRKLYDQARAEDEMELAKVTSVVQTSKAITLDKPVSPNKLLSIVGGALAGLIAAAGVLIFAVLTNRTFLSEGSAERFLGLPVLGSVPLRQPDYQRRLA
jgi:uncharacterized protein involved in exopolysaccharide biosynthesis